MTNYQGTRIEEPPTAQGRGGRAWICRQLDPGQRSKKDHDAHLANYIVQAMNRHPFWDYWSVGMIHLRDIPGVKPANLQFKGATHELMIAALNPERPLPPLDIPGHESWKVAFLTPIDVTQQLQVQSDAQALEVLELAVLMIVNGVASPDQDWRGWWKTFVEQTAVAVRQLKVS